MRLSLDRTPTWCFKSTLSNDFPWKLNRVVCTLLALGTAYKVYRNRNNYVIEFRDNVLMTKLSSLCHRLAIAPLIVFSLE